MQKQSAEAVQAISDSFGQLKRAMQAYVLHQEDSVQVSPAQIELLRTIHCYQPVSHKALAAHMQLTPGAVTQLIAGLDEADCIVRTADTTDRRISYVSVSKLGKRTLDNFQKLRKQLLIGAFSELAEEDLQTYLRVQHHLINWLEHNHPKKSK
jgi:DNA-binding MarR family transcriptional regulator